MSIWNRKGQSTAEYAIVLGVVIAALVGMQLYVKRGMNSKLKDVSDHWATDTASGDLNGDHLKQYEPYYTGAGGYETDVARQKVTETMTAGGQIARTNIDEESTRKTTGAGVVQGSNLATDNDWQ